MTQPSLTGDLRPREFRKKEGWFDRVDTVMNPMALPREAISHNDEEHSCLTDVGMTTPSITGYVSTNLEPMLKQTELCYFPVSRSPKVVIQLKSINSYQRRLLHRPYRLLKSHFYSRVRGCE